MSFLRHNVDEDVLEEEKPLESKLHRASQMIGAMHIQGAWHRQTFKPLGNLIETNVTFCYIENSISAAQDEFSMDEV